MQLLIFNPMMDPLVQIHTYVINTEAQGWANMGSVSTASSVSQIMWDMYLEDWRQHIHDSVGRAPGEDNKMSEPASRLTHLPYQKCIYHFCTHFPQSKTWRLPPLSSVCRQNITTMLHNKQSPRVYPQPSSRKAPLPGANGGTSAAVYK